MFSVMQTLANKQRYWVAFTKVRPNGAYVGVTKIDPFMKVWTTSEMERFI